MKTDLIIFMRNGQDVTEAPFVDDAGSWYSAGWPKGATDEQLAALGIVKVIKSPPAAPEPPSLKAQVEIFVRLVDAENDAIVRHVVGERSVEYLEAEEQAKEYKAAGYSGSVPTSVASWVAASGLTPQAAADSILAQSASWRHVAGLMRAARLGHKAQAAAATTQAQLDAVRASWATSIGQIRAALGLV